LSTARSNPHRPSGSPLAFQNFLRINNEWKPATLPNNPFITGDSFPLVTSQVKLEDSRIRCIGEGKQKAPTANRCRMPGIPKSVL